MKGNGVEGAADDKPEYTINDVMMNLKRNIRLQKHLSRGEDILIANQLAGDWRILPKYVDNDLVADDLIKME